MALLTRTSFSAPISTIRGRRSIFYGSSSVALGIAAFLFSLLFTSCEDENVNPVSEKTTTIIVLDSCTGEPIADAIVRVKKGEGLSIPLTDPEDEGVTDKNGEMTADLSGNCQNGDVFTIEATGEEGHILEDSSFTKTFSSTCCDDYDTLRIPIAEVTVYISDLSDSLLSGFDVYLSPDQTEAESELENRMMSKVSDGIFAARFPYSCSGLDSDFYIYVKGDGTGILGDKDTLVNVTLRCCDEISKHIRFNFNIGTCCDKDIKRDTLAIDSVLQVGEKIDFSFESESYINCTSKDTVLEATIEFLGDGSLPSGLIIEIHCQEAGQPQKAPIILNPPNSNTFDLKSLEEFWIVVYGNKISELRYTDDIQITLSFKDGLLAGETCFSVAVDFDINITQSGCKCPREQIVYYPKLDGEGKPEKEIFLCEDQPEIEIPIGGETNPGELDCKWIYEIAEDFSTNGLELIEFNGSGFLNPMEVIGGDRLEKIKLRYSGDPGVVEDKIKFAVFKDDVGNRTFCDSLIVNIKFELGYANCEFSGPTGNTIDLGKHCCIANVVGQTITFTNTGNCPLECDLTASVSGYGGFYIKHGNKESSSIRIDRLDPGKSQSFQVGIDYDCNEVYDINNPKLDYNGTLTIQSAEGSFCDDCNIDRSYNLTAKSDTSRDCGDLGKDLQCIAEWDHNGYKQSLVFETWDEFFNTEDDAFGWENISGNVQLDLFAETIDPISNSVTLSHGGGVNHDAVRFKDLGFLGDLPAGVSPCSLMPDNIISMAKDPVGWEESIDVTERDCFLVRISSGDIYFLWVGLIDSNVDLGETRIVCYFGCKILYRF